ncbi:DUF739 family protein [Aedoeadaptatus acetigenes]|uniref:DUF739 family protein n=1 Tax=Aedoeadaptatus acetigenes TaxID=2981723 RepID=UPI0011DDB2BD|nr:DUF739 family protein [Aedoeadaptatus acetigenes]MCU6786378.1 DUF739 family protein [Aedoeadaptatus acetigenes]
MEYIAEQLGVNRKTLYLKLNGETEFKASEIAILRDLLEMSPEEQERYFFTPKGELNSL